MGLCSGYNQLPGQHLPVVVRKGLCRAGKAFENLRGQPRRQEKAHSEPRRVPTVFTETGEVQIAARAWGSTSGRRQWNRCAKTASLSKLSPIALDPDDLLEQLLHTQTHTHTHTRVRISHSIAHTMQAVSFHHPAAEKH